ncbi:MAG: hypothetical protein HGB18_01740 [Candidatus Moranbacteria bacterium]|nr:hypothetical protein [Candidatus Moranbacteria bacterium]
MLTPVNFQNDPLRHAKRSLRLISVLLLIPILIPAICWMLPKGAQRSISASADRLASFLDGNEYLMYEITATFLLFVFVFFALRIVTELITTISRHLLERFRNETTEGRIFRFHPVLTLTLTFLATIFFLFTEWGRNSILFLANILFLSN